ncbi:hypothetical protein ALC56_03926 [Trachymyrmex septentrionalis]|uniref:Uncharacterized protein n=1 Tax=Trachymyrmex septentrionalis TaxID=34720 RepID=A0A151JZC4_9HYME|nr:hypothetical protein ALC56_03926 [Trachymyrmex septentrionalis]
MINNNDINIFYKNHRLIYVFKTPLIEQNNFILYHVIPSKFNLLLNEYYKDFIGMLDNLNQAQRKEEDMRRASKMSKRITITRQISRLSTISSIAHSDTDDSDYVENSPEAEMSGHGRVAGRVYKEYLHNGGNNFTLSVLLMIFIISQIATTGNDWLSY